MMGLKKRSCQSLREVAKNLHFLNSPGGKGRGWRGSSDIVRGLSTRKMLRPLFAPSAFYALPSICWALRGAAQQTYEKSRCSPLNLCKVLATLATLFLGIYCTLHLIILSDSFQKLLISPRYLPNFPLLGALLIPPLGDLWWWARTWKQIADTTFIENPLRVYLETIGAQRKLLRSYCWRLEALYKLLSNFFFWARERREKGRKVGV